jgi:hypothetical protein
MKPLCAICVRRDAYALHELDGKDRPICRECASVPVPEPDSIAVGGFRDGTPAVEALAVIRRQPGVTFTGIREALGIPGPGCHKWAGRRNEHSKVVAKYCAAVRRLAKAGVVRRVGEWPHWTYWPTERSA